ncbi:hypothetical protein [Herbiconiux solani]|uniref:hypothetical protein n=1 Tax=Herbiconiux solani TaxID=661329 RepID=UPI00082606E1|nr:hypothetical protein [Herbiconiux solani]
MSMTSERDLTDHERALLLMAIDTMSTGAEQARAQLAVASYGGPAHEGTHPCLVLALPEGVEPIPRGAEYPLTLYVAPDAFTVGTIDVFIENGLLTSLEWSATSLVHDAPEVTEFPSLDRISVNPNFGGV